MEISDIHLSILFITVLVILYSDHLGLAYFLGKKILLPERTVVLLHRLTWVGLVGMIVSGVILTVPAWHYYLQEPAFLIKIGFVLVLVVNGYAIGSLSKVATTRPFSALATKEKRTLILSGALSAMGWVGSAVIGYFLL